MRENNPSWRSALSSVSGINVIADTTDGRHYVGSAGGQGGFWQRWTSYAESGHGQNKELKAVLTDLGDTHSNGWQIAILEVCDLNADEQSVVARESYWKDVLQSRQFGMNEN